MDYCLLLPLIRLLKLLFILAHYLLYCLMDGFAKFVKLLIDHSFQLFVEFLGCTLNKLLLILKLIIQVTNPIFSLTALILSWGLFASTTSTHIILVFLIRILRFTARTRSYIILFIFELYRILVAARWPLVFLKDFLWWFSSWFFCILSNILIISVEFARLDSSCYRWLLFRPINICAHRESRFLASSRFQCIILQWLNAKWGLFDMFLTLLQSVARFSIFGK
jgi:hypothetical protein